jgi:Protein of unknown function (DUF3501)
MQKISRSDLLSLEQYALQRPKMREEIIAHKRIRNVQVGPNMTWCFEDRYTIRYQIQEMLRIERIFESEGIQSELDAYNPLVPDGQNWKVTLLIEYPDPVQRARELAQLKSVEDRCWIRVSELARVFAIADEDIERENEEKTSSVHFLRFELQPGMIKAMKGGAALSLGVDHPHYRHDLSPVAPATRESLLGDLA